MEEVTQLLTIEIDQKAVNQAIDKTLESKKAIQELLKEREKLDLSTEKGAKALLKNEVAVKALNDTVRQNTNVLKANEKADQSKTGSITQMREQLKIVSKQWADLSKNERENTEEGKRLTKQKLKLTESLKAEEKATGDTRRNVGNYTEGVKDALSQSGLFGRELAGVSKAQAVLGAVTSKTTGKFKLLKTAIAASGIGLLVLAVVSVTSAFKDSESGQNKFAKIMGVIGAITGNLRDLLADLGEKIIWAFSNPKKALEGFATAIKNNITNRIEGLINLIPSLGNAIELVFKGKFKEAGKVAADAAGKAVLGVNSITDSLGNASNALGDFIEQNKEEAALAAKVADDRAKADMLERELIVDKSILESKIAALRLKSRQEDQFGAEERKKALLDAQELEDQLLKKEKEVLELRSEAIQLENTFSRSNKENLKAEAEAKAEVNRIEAARLNQQRSTQRELNRVNKEIERDSIAISKEKAKAIKEEEKAKQKAMADSFARIEAELDAQDEADDIRIESATIAAEEITRTEIAALQDRFLQGVISKEEYEQELSNIEAAALLARQSNAEMAIEEANANLLLTEEERVKIITDAEEEIRKVKEIQSDLDVKEKYAEIDRDSAAAENKKQLAQQSLTMLIDVLGKESAAGKAAASFQAILDTYKGINASLDLPFPFNIIQSALIGAQGFANVAKINSTPKPQLPSASTSGGGGGSQSRKPRRFRGFADGGYTGDGFGSPDSSGYKPAGIVHEGEYVVKKSIVEDPGFSGMISSLESARLRGYAGGGFVGRSASSNVGQSSEVTALRSEIAQLAKRPSIVQVSEINRVQGQVVSVENQGTLRG